MSNNIPTGPDARIAATKRWHNAYAKRLPASVKLAAAKKALCVICFTQEISQYLAVNDPMALSQCQQALFHTDYTNFLRE